MAGKSILLVEDNRTEEALMLYALSKSEATSKIVIARDGAEALQFLFNMSASSEYSTNQPSMVLLDLNLPKIGGLEVLRRIRSHGGTRMIPVIILSSSDLEADVRSSYLLGANSYIKKQTNFEQFSQTVKQLVSYWLGINQLPPISIADPKPAGYAQASAAIR